MRLVSNWKLILKHAWSVRLIALAVVFSGLEIALPFIDEFFYLPRGAMAFFSVLAGCGVPAFSDGTYWRRVTDRAIVS